MRHLIASYEGDRLIAARDESGLVGTPGLAAFSEATDVNMVEARAVNDEMERLLVAAESVGGGHPDVHPVLRECHDAAKALRAALDREGR
jgi:hypothetical protein